MYETRYGTDWDTLTLDAAIERAFALGIMAGFGHGLPEEYERVKATTSSTYERAMVEVSFAEGNRDGGAVATDLETAWTALLEDTEPVLEPTTPPRFVTLVGALDLPTKRPTVTDLPQFLEFD